MKNKIKTFFKEKGFYMSLLVGVIAILAVGIISADMLTGENEVSPKVADNQQEASLAEEPDTENFASGKSEQQQLAADNNLQEEELAQDITEAEVKTEITETAKNSEPATVETADANTTSNKEEAAKAVEKTETVKADEPATAPVISQSENISNLKFDEEKGLLWPIAGEVLLPYSIEKSIYFKTLAQYKCNPAMMIAGKEDMDVLCAYNGIITAMDENEETGLTITMSIGDNYKVLYGNLKDVSWQAGDYVSEGTYLGKLASPTKYYVTEGTNLYLKIMQDDKSVDPMLLLR